MRLPLNRSAMILAALALVGAGCQVQANGEIPCLQDVTCPDQYPVCGPSGTCIDNGLPTIHIDAFSVGSSLPTSSGSTTISSGASATLYASFAGRGSATGTLSCAPGCNGTLAAATLASGGTVTVTGSVNGALTYTLAVASTNGATATATVTVNVVPPATAIGLSASSSVVHQGGSATLTPTFNFGSSPAVPGTAVIVGDDGSTYANLTSGNPIQVAPSTPTTVYTLHVANAAGLAATTAPSVTLTLVTGTWSVLNTNTFAALRGATVTALDNGKVLIAGGVDGSDTPSSTAYLCDATGACATKSGPSGMSSPRAYHTAVKIDSGAPNNAGKVLLAGGYTATGPATPTATAEFYDPATDTFSSTTALSGSARARHVAVLLDTHNILIAGGTDGTSNLSTAIEYDAGGAPPTVASLSAMGQARAGFTGTLLTNGKVLIVGGVTGNVTAELFDPAGGTFSSTGTLPAAEDKRFHTAVLLTGVSPNVGKVVISGGVTGAGGGTPSATQFLYTPTSGTFASAPSLSTVRSNHAAISLSNTNVLICGGTASGTDTLKTCDLYDHSAGAGSVLVTGSMFEARKDFGLAPIIISSVVEILAAGNGTVSTPMRFAETYNLN
jgi:Galactose oxidase, central domain